MLHEGLIIEFHHKSCVKAKLWQLNEFLGLTLFNSPVGFHLSFCN